MSSKEIIAGIDLGSKSIKIAVGQEVAGELNIIGLAEEPSEGISKGMIISIEDTISSLSSCLEKIDKMISMQIEHAYIGISGSHIISQESKGVIAISRADGEIKDDDVRRVLEAAQTVVTPPNYEFIHSIPRSFTVDNQPGILDPIGMTGVRLEVESQIILGLSNQIKNLTKCFYRVGVNIDDKILSVLAASETVLSRRQRDFGVAVINLGHTTTSVVVFEEGDILLAKVLPIGARHITGDISLGLKIPLDLAEAIKLRYGTTLPDKVDKHEQINLKDLDENEEGLVSRKEVAKIIEARCEEIFEIVDKELMTVARSGKLPAGVVLIGGGSKLDGLVETAKSVFKTPASIGVSQGFTSGINKSYDPMFSTAVGLVLYGPKSSIKNTKVLKNETFSKVKKMFKNLMPF